MKKRIALCVFLCFQLFFSQEKKDSVELSGKIEKITSFDKNPTKAALYSAAFPGLGQFYNKYDNGKKGILKYWKVPLAWGLIGGGIGFITFYSKEYSRFKEAYIAKLNGQPNEFDALTKERIASAMDEQRRNRDFAVFFTILFYALNILDATVDAHLSPFDHDKDLSLAPVLLENPITYENKVGISLSFKF